MASTGRAARSSSAASSLTTAVVSLFLPTDRRRGPFHHRRRQEDPHQPLVSTASTPTSATPADTVVDAPTTTTTATEATAAAGRPDPYASSATAGVPNDVPNDEDESEVYTNSSKTCRQWPKSWGRSARRGRRSPRSRWWAQSRHTFAMYLVQAYRETKRNRTQHCIGCFSIFFVVFVVALLVTVLAYAPVLFLVVSESYYGELDLVITALAGSHASGLNYTAVQNVIDTAAAAEGQSPQVEARKRHTARYFQISSRIVPATGCRYWNAAYPANSTFLYLGPADVPGDSEMEREQKADARQVCENDFTVCAPQYCSRWRGVGIILINTRREAELGIGRQWSLQPPPKGSGLLTQSLASWLNVKVSDYVVVDLNFRDRFEIAIKSVNRTLDGMSGANDDVWNFSRSVSFPMLVSGVMDSSDKNGKFGKLVTDQVMVMEMDTFLATIADNLHPRIPEDFRQTLSALSADLIYQSVDQTLFALPDPRANWYIQPEFQILAESITQWASDIVFTVGYNMVTSDLPLLGDLKDGETVSSMLHLILSFAVIVLLSLSVFLVYSLLMVSVETRIFELGIYRMVGMSRSGVVKLLLVQALGYAVPAWIIGLSLAQLAWVPLRWTCESIFGVVLSALLLPRGIILGTILGLLSPLVSAVLPILRALNHNIHDALETRRNRTKAVMITLRRTVASSIMASPTLLLTGGLLTTFGFLAYYLIPNALVSANISLLFDLLLVVMLAMILGLAIASLNLQPVLERCQVALMFSSVLRLENKAMRHVVVKNLIAHRMRNRKTTIMFALSLGFILFISVSVQVELRSLTYSKAREIGTSLTVYASAYYADGSAAGITRVHELEAMAEEEPLVTGYAWITYALDELWVDTGGATTISNAGQIASFPQKVYGVTPNLLEVAKDGDEFLKITQQDPTLAAAYPLLTEQLYTAKGSRSAVMGSYFRDALQLVSQNMSDLVLLGMTPRWTDPPTAPQNLEPVAFRVLAFAAGMPFFTASARKQKSVQEMVVSIPEYVTLSRGRVASVGDVPLNKMVLQLSPAAQRADIRRIKQRISSIIDWERITDLDDALSGYDLAGGILAWVFDGVTVVAMMISFFSLNTSMYVNITEQAKEIGIFRALGSRKAGIYRLYAYEAFVLTFVSAILGVGIGVVIGYTMTLQRAMVTEIPIAFQFPYRQVVIVFLGSALCAVLATVSPVRALMNRKLVSLLREL